MLDQDQAKVVAHETGPAAVLAGAGSGKTRCTTERAARRLVEAGVPSDGLILLTFTNKAAAEMRERLGKRLPEGIKLPWIGTFHSLGNRLLRTHGKAIGIPRNATLMDADDANRMLDAFLAAPFADKNKRFEAIQIREAIAAHGLDLDDEADLEAAAALCERKAFGPQDARRLTAALRRYEGEKRRAGVLDFSDLILLPARLLRRKQDLAEKLQGQFRDVTVDEAQDTDAAQFRLLELMMPRDNTVLVVGDDDQAIYEWRHARPENMRDFIERYDATVYRLERNYRSTPAIVTSGAVLVRHNENRLEKNPYAVRQAPGADTVRLAEYDDAEAMAEGVAARIAASMAEGTPATEIAVLYRKNRLSRTIESELLRRGIPYWVKAGMDLLSYADVRMMLAVGRMAANRRDIRALSRLAELIPGLGAKGVSRLIEGGEEPLRQVWRLPPQTARRVQQLAEGLDRLHRDGPARLFDWCNNDPLFQGWLAQRAKRQLKSGGRDESTHEINQAIRPALGRMRAVQAAMRKRLESLDSAAPEDRWSNALEVIASGTDEAANEEDKVTLATIHGSKGLEWSEVHLFGFTEGLMPMERDDVVENLAEERRLAYVAITRAQNRIMLHHADHIDLGVGNGEEHKPVSRFLEEIASGHDVERIERRKGREAAPDDGEKKDAKDWLAQMRKAIT